MAIATKKSFSLLTLLLMTVIVAMAVSQFSMMRKMAEAEAEVNEARRLYGYIRIRDAEKTIVQRLEDTPERRSAFRVHIPPGRHYILHISDVPFTGGLPPADLPVSSTMSMNSWRNGANVILSYSIYAEGEQHRMVVHTESEELFNYVIEGWTNGPMPNSGWTQESGVQKEFARDDTIQLMWHLNEATQRGVVLWMEPVDQWQKRKAAMEAKKERETASPTN
jgi:hypothetical protein